MDRARILAYFSRAVEQELLLRNDSHVAENRSLRNQLETPLRHIDAQRFTLADIAHRFGRSTLADTANAAKPDTTMGWYQRLVAHTGGKRVKGSGVSTLLYSIGSVIFSSPPVRYALKIRALTITSLSAATAARRSFGTMKTGFCSSILRGRNSHSKEGCCTLCA